MPPIVILDNEYITIKYLPDKKIIYHTVHQPFGGQPLRDALIAGFDALQYYKVCKWLSDERKNGPMSADDVEWGNKNLNQRAMEVGWKYWALVVPEQIVAAGAMRPAIDILYELGLRMMVFSSVEEASGWLDKFKD